MKNILPTTRFTRGFTLIELLVVIAILAILGLIALAILTGTQSRARDAKRKEDVSQMANSMEANYVPNSGYVTPMAGSWFADGVVPSNPGPGGSQYATTYNGNSTFIFCSALENSTGNATASNGGLGVTNGSWFCKRNSQ